MNRQYKTKRNDGQNNKMPQCSNECLNDLFGFDSSKGKPNRGFQSQPARTLEVHQGA